MPSVQAISATLSTACSGDFNPIKKPLIKQATAFQAQLASGENIRGRGMTTWSINMTSDTLAQLCNDIN